MVRTSNSTLKKKKTEKKKKKKRKIHAKSNEKDKESSWNEMETSLSET